MSGDETPIRSDLAKIDAHEITAEEYAEIPELDDEFFQRADLYDGDRLIRRGAGPKTTRRAPSGRE